MQLCVQSIKNHENGREISFQYARIKAYKFEICMHWNHILNLELCGPLGTELTLIVEWSTTHYAKMKVLGYLLDNT